MPDLTIDPTDPDFDLAQYSPEDLVAARVQSLRPGEIGFVIPRDVREKVEADILDRLDEDQKKRREINLSIRRKRTIQAAEELLSRNRIIHANPPLKDLSGDRLEDWYSSHAPDDAAIPAGIDNAGDVPSEASRESTDPDYQQVIEQVVDLLQKQIDNAESDTKTAKRIAAASVLIAGLSLIVAAITLFRPVAIDQPDGKPVPVQIIQHTEDGSSRPAGNLRTAGASED